jgi:hypothetical protein
MYLIYLDEAGNSGENLDDPLQPFHVMAGVIIRDSNWLTLEKHYDGFCGKACAKYPPRPPRFELHAGEIFQGAGVFDTWSPADRAELLTDSLNTFTSHDLPIIYGAIDKQKLKAQYADPFAPHGLAFMLCAERIERWFKAHAPNEIGMLICDETKVKSEFKKSLKQYQKFGIPLGVKNEKLEHIVDTIHFADSHESYGIQLADAANYFIKRQCQKKANSTAYYDLIKGKIWDARIFP